MKRYKLCYLPLSSEDLNSTTHYIFVVLRNPAAVRRSVNDMEMATQERSNMAESFAPFPSTRTCEHPYYPIYARNFIAFYVVLGDTMEARRVLYNRRDISTILQ